MASAECKCPGNIEQFVDFQNDTTPKDIEIAAREGYRSIEHLKRYTLLGFGTDQGKLGNINGMAILSKALGQEMSETGTTTFRPFYTPVTFGAIAGRELGSEFFDPVRKTAMHEWHVTQSAEFENVGQWKRPWYYPKSGETMQQAVDRECLAARNQVAMLDASTLGKIEIYGPNAVDFLNLVYTNSWSRLTTGSCRYGLMLGEDGMVMDDGVTCETWRKSLLHDDNNRWCSPCVDMDGTMAADRVAMDEGVFHLSNRTVGGHFDFRTESSSSIATGCT